MLLVAALSIALNYVAEFNSLDDELYTNAIPNAAAGEFLRSNVPEFCCPDKQLERIYYFRWWTYRKHLRRAPADEWVVSEFLPDVSWSGYGNTISCPLVHHVREGRWLRDRRFVDSYLKTMVEKGTIVGRGAYANCPARLFLDLALVTGDDSEALRLLDRLASNYEKWERGWDATSLSGRHVSSRRPFTPVPLRAGFRPERGLFDLAGDREGSEFALSEDGARPMVNSMMWAEASAIAELARRRGDMDLSVRFAKKAESLAEAVRTRLWNERRGFFTVLAADGKQDDVCELHGYAPFYFEMPLAPECDRAFAMLTDEKGFLAPLGLTFPRRDTPGFRVGVDIEGHECLWCGPSWPYATSVALTAFANRLHARARTHAEAASFRMLLRQYAAQHRLRKEDGTEVPWIDEDADPFTGDWLARRMLLMRAPRGARFPERGKDYNHSTFCDIVISGLVGFRPAAYGSFTVDPLADPAWDAWSLRGVRWRGHDVDIAWKSGDGLSVSIDGRVAARRADIGLLTCRIDQ